MNVIEQLFQIQFVFQFKNVDMTNGAQNFMITTNQKPKTKLAGSSNFILPFENVIELSAIKKNTNYLFF